MASDAGAERAPCQWCAINTSVQEVAARVDAAEARTKEAWTRLEQLLADHTDDAQFRAAISKQTEQLAKSLDKGSQECSRCVDLVAECSQRMDDVVNRLGELDRVVAAHHDEASTRLDGVNNALQKRVSTLDRLVAEKRREAQRQAEDIRHMVEMSSLAPTPSKQAEEEVSTQVGSRLAEAVEGRLEAALTEALSQFNRHVDQGAGAVSQAAYTATKQLGEELNMRQGSMLGQLREEVLQQAAAELAQARKGLGEETSTALRRLREEFGQQLEESLEEGRATLKLVLAEQHGIACAAQADFQTVLGEWKGGLLAVQELLATASENRWRERQREWEQEHARVIGALKSAVTRVHRLEHEAVSGNEELSAAGALLGHAWTDGSMLRRTLGITPGSGRGSARAVAARLQRASSASAIHQPRTPPPARLRRGLPPNWT
mmetsp:Transcript_54083/g.139263  ORF Transcript_54083/g.139263 Transcript_54083/m.139263 type:complete len:434 (+) Transcript_54083:3-1304(+)